jgi:Zn-dependent membrane protease YugP
LVGSYQKEPEIVPIGFGFSPQWIALMIATVALGLITQGFIKSSFRKWSGVPVSSGMTGAQVAETILSAHGLGSVEIKQVGGKLSDNYDPRSKVLNLSGNVYGVSSVAAAGVAAHEAGHAVQDAKHYVWGTVRSTLVPVANIGSSASWVLIFVGFWIQVSGLVWLGIAFYAMAVLFQIVTLPVEFDASRRAISALETANVMDAQQLAGARQVLTAAALTYVAAALIAALQLLYFMGLAGRD